MTSMSLNNIYSSNGVKPGLGATRRKTPDSVDPRLGRGACTQNVALSAGQFQGRARPSANFAQITSNSWRLSFDVTANRKAPENIAVYSNLTNPGDPIWGMSVN